MKRGAVLLAFALLLAFVSIPAALSSYASVGSYSKSAGETWEVDDIPMSIVLREIELENFAYVSFGNVTEGIATGTCADIDNYRICLNSSTLGPRFDPETKRTPYVYSLKVLVNAATAGVGLTVTKTKLLVNEETQARLTVTNTGDFDIPDMTLSLRGPSFEFSQVSKPCSVDGAGVVWNGLLGKGNTDVCDFVLRPTAPGVIAIQPSANFSDGRKQTIVKGPSISIDSQSSLVSVRFRNATAQLGTWVGGLIDINNSDKDNGVTVSGVLFAPNTEVRGTTTFDRYVATESSISLPFEMHLVRTGNTSVFINSTVRQGSTTATLKDSKSVRAMYPAIKLKTFGTLNLTVAGNANIDVEAENLGDLPLHNVTLRIWPPASMLMPLNGPAIEMLPGRNEQLYTTTVFVPLNNSNIFLPINISVDTDFGEHITFNSNVTLRTGKATTKVTGQPTATVPAKNTTTSKTTKPTQQIPTKQTAAQTPEQKAATLNTFLIIIVVALVVGAIFWFLSQANILRGPKPPQRV